MADEFIRVRLLRITGADLSQFEFDFDLTWFAFFLNAEGRVYGRFGGRDAKGPDTRNSLAGLRHAMQAALETHKREGQSRPEAKAPFYIEKVPVARNYNGCIHCHQVKEILRQEEKNAGVWKRDSIWVYPLPENIGITLELDRGDVVSAVKPGSPADKAGIKSADVLRTVNGLPVHSFGDLQYALHKAPTQGEIAVAWSRGGTEQQGKLTVTAGWKKTNLTWRPSLLDLLPSLTVFGYDLTAKEKESLKLDAKRLAFRQASPVHSEAAAFGVQENDVIIGIDDQRFEMSADEFLGYIRQNHLVGDRITLNVLRDGKRVNLPLKLK